MEPGGENSKDKKVLAVKIDGDLYRELVAKAVDKDEAINRGLRLLLKMENIEAHLITLYLEKYKYLEHLERLKIELETKKKQLELIEKQIPIVEKKIQSIDNAIKEDIVSTRCKNYLKKIQDFVDTNGPDIDAIDDQLWHIVAYIEEIFQEHFDKKFDLEKFVFEYIWKDRTIEDFLRDEVGIGANEVS